MHSRSTVTGADTVSRSSQLVRAANPLGASTGLVAFVTEWPIADESADGALELGPSRCLRAVRSARFKLAVAPIHATLGPRALLVADGLLHHL